MSCALAVVEQLKATAAAIVAVHILRRFPETCNGLPSCPSVWSQSIISLFMIPSFFPPRAVCAYYESEVNLIFRISLFCHIFHCFDRRWCAAPKTSLPIVPNGQSVSAY
jgi:hypothetical protein